MSPVQRTMAHLKSKGAKVAIVEHWNSFVQIKFDLFGWIDVLAILDGKFVGVQTTTQAHAADRIAKAKGNLALEAWLRAGGILVVHCWAKRGARGKRKLWTLKEEFLTLDMLLVESDACQKDSDILEFK